MKGNAVFILSLVWEEKRTELGAVKGKITSVGSLVGLRNCNYNPSPCDGDIISVPWIACSRTCGRSFGFLFQVGISGEYDSHPLQQLSLLTKPGPVFY